MKTSSQHLFDMKMYQKNDDESSKKKISKFIVTFDKNIIVELDRSRWCHFILHLRKFSILKNRSILFLVYTKLKIGEF